MFCGEPCLITGNQSTKFMRVYWLVKKVQDSDTAGTLACAFGMFPDPGWRPNNACKIAGLCETLGVSFYYSPCCLVS
jgi:hypothetical protein